MLLSVTGSAKHLGCYNLDTYSFLGFLHIDIVLDNHIGMEKANMYVPVVIVGLPQYI